MRFASRVLLLASLTVALSSADATQITNVAQVTWSENGATQRLQSNPVTLAVEPAAARLSIATPDPAATATEWVPAQSCLPSGNQATAAAGTSGARIGVATATQVEAGQPLVLIVDAPAADRDPAVAEQLLATITSTAGDRETATLRETGVDTGRFSAAVATQESASPASGDCLLQVQQGDQVQVTVAPPSATGASAAPIVSTTYDVLVDPRGRVFDSNDGGPVSGASVSLVNADNGAPATVFAPDGKTAWPATVVSGAPVTDAGGGVYPTVAGGYRFPLVRPGRYRLQIKPPAPYVAPSVATAAQIATLTRPNGLPYAVSDGSYGGAFTVPGTGPIRVDIPVDSPATPVTVTKTASRAEAAPGDPVLYTVTITNADATHIRRDLTLTDQLPAALRLRPASVRVDGSARDTGVIPGADGRTLTLALKRVLANSVRTITYAAEVRPDAAAGQATNTAVVTDAHGTAAHASATVRVTRETIAGRMTLIGRVVSGPCDAPRPQPGVGGVRLLLEDGSYAVTDADGRYHFEGLIPTRHVVAVDRAALPAGATLIDCVNGTRAAGNPATRFVEGQGGSLAVADFHLALAPGRPAPVADDAIPVAPTDRAAAGAERNWFADGSASIAWLFPAADHNPRSPAVRVAIRHLPTQRVELSADGKPVDPITFDGKRESPDARYTVSLWRGVPLTGETTRLTAVVRDAEGGVAATMTRELHFVTAAAQAVFLPERSRLVADGIARPVLAVRILDRAGRAVHAGTVGDLDLSAPYEAAQAVDAEQARVLSGLERARPTWRVAGGDGIAYIPLAPTTISGALSLSFSFRDHDTVRVQKLDSWLEPGARAWTIVGLAEGGVGHDALLKHLERGEAGGDALAADARLALYAQGRVRGRWLLTLAYDSAKRRGDQRLSGEIDPNTYYTVYGDRSERRFGAASTGKLYLKLERRQFYALFGDFQTGFGDTVLGRYERAATGFKAEARGAHVAASAFAARFATTHRRDEIQGNGLSGPYALTAREIAANGEQVVIEVRDRLRSDRIVSTRALTRFVDYDIDYAAGTLRFSEPVLSRDSDLDPQFIVVEYELLTADGGRINAGARATAVLGKLRVGATALRNADQTGRAELGAVDAKLKVAPGTELRAEAALSRAAGAGVRPAWLVEAEHHDAALDVLGYARELDTGFGLAEQNAAERGRRKIGVDARVRVAGALSVAASAWDDQDLASDAFQRAIRVKAEWKGHTTDLRLGVVHAEESGSDGARTSSTLVEGGATRRLFEGRVELDAAASIALGHAASIDFPAQDRLTARWRATDAVTLVGTYEIDTGTNVSARIARIGFDLKPWAGAKLTSALAEQDIPEQGRRAYAAYGLAQSLPLGSHWSVDATLDGSRTLRGIAPGQVNNPAQPSAAGGYVGTFSSNGSGGSGVVTEDFTALTGGATYRAGLWSGTGRAEYRFGQLGDRAALTGGLIRRLGDGGALGALATWSRVDAAAGSQVETVNIAVSAALRPAASAWAMLGKLEWRDDSVTDATAGTAAGDGSPLTVTGDARSRRVVASGSFNWSPRTADGWARDEVALFLGERWVMDRVAGYDLDGFTTMIGLDARLGLGDRVELGIAGSVRGRFGADYAWAVGPTLTFAPARDMNILVGWNVHGFADHDFEAARTTREGPFVTARLKFDQGSFGFLGLDRR